MTGILMASISEQSTSCLSHLLLLLNPEAGGVPVFVVDGDDGEGE